MARNLLNKMHPIFEELVYIWLKFSSRREKKAFAVITIPAELADYAGS